MATSFASTIPDGFYRISIKALILDDEQKFLLAKQEDGTWDFPGGGIDYHETPEETLRREILEEMGIEIASISAYPVYFFTFFSENKIPFANVFFLTKLKSLDFTPSKECIEIQFLSKEEAMKENLRGNVKLFLTQNALQNLAADV